MPTNVETMMYVREKPWHGLGTMVVAIARELACFVWGMMTGNMEAKSV